jgi:hypothetical protein
MEMEMWKHRDKDTETWKHGHYGAVIFTFWQFPRLITHYITLGSQELKSCFLKFNWPHHPLRKFLSSFSIRLFTDQVQLLVTQDRMG